MNWQNGAEWASGLGQYAIFSELAVMGALWIVGALVNSLFSSKKGNRETVDDAE
jgi:hypothetical protein